MLGFGMVRDERVKQVAVALGLIGLVALMMIGIGLGGFLPGLAGEWFARILGIVTTPFLMEGSFIVLGFILVITLNLWRLHREGDEFVYLEEVKNAPADLPAHARWAAYRNPPLDSSDPAPVDQLEGALAIGDHQSAAELLAAMSDEERSTPEALALRIRLARETGREELAAKLEALLHSARTSGI